IDEMRSFEFDWKFAGDPSENVTAAWLSLIPKGQGVVRLPLPNDFNNGLWNIAAYHTLHCLFTMRESFFTFYNMAIKPEALKAGNPAYILKHGRHCFEYIRQALMCNPDLSLEPVEEVTGRLIQWGFKRQCKNFTEISAWAYDMRASDNEGIEGPN
ncbi:hypothetical protein PG993_000296, partial [Apiospora rasikravindrae]